MSTRVEALPEQAHPTMPPPDWPTAPGMFVSPVSESTNSQERSDVDPYANRQSQSQSKAPVLPSLPLLKPPLSPIRGSTDHLLCLALSEAPAPSHSPDMAQSFDDPLNQDLHHRVANVENVFERARLKGAS